MLDTLGDWAKVDPKKYGDLPVLEDYDVKNRLYREYFADMFNLAVLPFYWADNEPQKGKLRYFEDEPHIHRRPPINKCIEFCKENNIKAKAHCLNYDGWDADYVKKSRYRR